MAQYGGAWRGWETSPAMGFTLSIIPMQRSIHSNHQNSNDDSVVVNFFFRHYDSPCLSILVFIAAASLRATMV